MRKTINILLLCLISTAIFAQGKVVKGQITTYNISTEQTFKISGICTDETGKPLKDVRVNLKNGVISAVSDENGKYSIEAGKSDVGLVFFYPNMRIEERAINFNNPVINCQLFKDDKDYTLLKHTKTATKWFDPANDNPKTYCNPTNIDYNFEYFQHNGQSKISCRSTADPIVVPYKGEYYIFSTNQSGYYVSKDLSKWKYIFAGFQRTPGMDDQCAPTVEVFGDTMVMLGSTYKHLPVWYTTDPKSGRWKHLAETAILPHWDPSLYLDDDGKMYLYYGSSNDFPVKGVEYSRSTFRPADLIKDLVFLQPKEHGWERFGMNNDDSVSLKPFIEGSFMTKHNGKYYLQYGAPGTEFKVYADGVYTSDKPLGPFTYQKSNPMCYKPGGFVLGSGHGGTFKDNYSNYWHISTCMLSLRETFERRIGIYPAGFDKDDVMYANTSFGDYPTFIPQGTEDHIKGNFSGWMLLSLNKKTWASSSDSIYTPENASDENMRTYWSAKTGDAGEWFVMDLGAVKKINAVQVNYYEHKADQYGKAFDVYHQYKIYSSLDGQNWELAIDKSDNDMDVPHDYVELKNTLETRYLKIENIHTASGNFALMDLRVFGKADGNLPLPAEKLKIDREKNDARNAIISWKPQKDCYGYNIYYGVAPDKMYNCITVYNDTKYNMRGLDKNTQYYFSIQSLSETGASEKSKPVFVK